MIKKISEITDNLDNIRKPLNSKERKEITTERKYPYYGANGIVDYVDKYLFDEELLCVAEDGGSWGENEKCSYIINGKCWVNNHAHVLRMKPGINIRYLMYFLNNRDLNSEISGAVVRKLTQKALNNIEIDIPEIEIQNDIVLKLDLINEAIENRKKALNDYKGLIDSLLNRFINTTPGELIKFKDLVKKEKHSMKRGPFGGSLKKEIFKKDGYLVYEQYHAINDDYTHNNRYFISEEKYNELTAFAVKPGDMIISCSGTFGRISEIPEFNFKPGIINQALLKVSLDNDIILNKYFLYYFKSDIIQNKIESLTRGCGITNFPSIDEIKNIDFFVPEVIEQEKFVESIEKIEKSKMVLESEINNLEKMLNEREYSYFN